MFTFYIMGSASYPPESLSHHAQRLMIGKPKGLCFVVSYLRSKSKKQDLALSDLLSAFIRNSYVTRLFSLSFIDFLSKQNSY